MATVRKDQNANALQKSCNIWKDVQFPIMFDVDLEEKLDTKTAVSVLRIEHERKLFEGLLVQERLN